MALPTPDEFGNYWFGDHSGVAAGPAIFKSWFGNRVTYILSLGADYGFVFEPGGLFRRFPTAEAAYQDLRKRAKKLKV